MVTSSDRGFLPSAIGGGLSPIGYAMPDSDDWVECCLGLWPGALLLDIRLKAHSRYYLSWNKGALQAKWGGRYVHERRLGNVNYQYPSDYPIRLLDPEAALPWILHQLQQNTILLLVCACRDYERCHRKVVTELILGRCQDAMRSSGMRFDLSRGVYVGRLAGGMQVVVRSGFFEACRSSFALDYLYDPQTWADPGDFAPGLVTLEPVSQGGQDGI